MQHPTELRSQLKQLKLSGILDTLEIRILECQKNDLHYQTFLSLLLQDELEARQERKIQKLIRRTRFGTEQTLEAFDFALAPHLNCTLI